MDEKLVFVDGKIVRCKGCFKHAQYFVFFRFEHNTLYLNHWLNYWSSVK